MAKVKDDNKLQINLRLDRNKDREIFEVIDLADNKTELIKDAIFYYIYQIEQGKVINRGYPYNKLNIKLDIKEEPEEYIKAIPTTVSNHTIEENIEDDYDNDNFDDIDF